MEEKRIIIARRVVPSFSTSARGASSSVNVIGMMVLDIKEKGAIGCNPTDINEFMKKNDAQLIQIAPYNIYGMTVAIFSIPEKNNEETERIS